MRDEFDKVLSHARSAWRFRYRALATAWVAALVGWVGVFMIPNEYETTARVYVDTNSLLRPLLEGIAVTASTNSSADLVRRALLGRPQLERVIDTTELHNRVQTTVERERLLKELMMDIRITADSSSPQAREANIFTIAYADQSRPLAFAVVKQLLEAFVSQSVGANRLDANTAQQFLREQIHDYERRLSEAETRLADFKKRNVGAMPDERGGYFQRLQTDMATLDNLNSNLQVAIRKRDSVRTKLMGGEGESSASTVTSTSFDARIADARTRHEDMLLRFTEEHPDVIALKENIARLEEQRDAEIKTLRSNVGGLGVGPATNSLVVQNLQIALNQAELEVTTLQAQVGDHQQRVAQLRDHINTLPEVEAKLAQLNRDYNVTRTEYERLLQRLESAKLSDAADRVDEVRFKVIDAPIEELLPARPKRGLLVIAVALAAIGLGLGVAVLTSQLQPVFVFARELSQAFKVPVLGVVSATMSQRQRLHRRLSVVAVVGLFAFICVTAVVLVAMRSRFETYSAELWCKGEHCEYR